ncbi:topoisomerase DNA-binding C4 zinc finger domain-containing protein [Pseudomonas sp. 3A(2025)]
MLLVLGAIASFFKQRKRRQRRAESTVSSVETQVAQREVTASAPEVVAQPVTPQVPKAKPKVKAQPAPAPVEPVAPACPHCKQTMVMRVARTGANAGGNFWGCASYPKCRGIRAIFAPLPSQRVQK